MDTGTGSSSSSLDRCLAGVAITGPGIRAAAVIRASESDSSGGNAGSDRQETRSGIMRFWNAMMKGW
jgi:hypothetical protein